jgi:hypothetical protein
VARRWVLLAAVVVLAAAGVTAAWQLTRHADPGPGTSADNGAASRPHGGGIPATPSGPSGQRILLGTYIALADKDTETAIEQRESAMGRRYNLQLTYYNWNDAFPDSGEATIVAHGRTPLMTWYGPGKDPGDNRTVAEITDGSDDQLILSQAEAIKNFGHRIYLRLMPEMNGTWYRGFGDPAAYRAAWRHVHQLFAQAGVSNVSWVWCPNVGPDDWDSYYPGDAYVDIIGVDGFSNVRYGYQSFEQMFAPFLTHFAGRKPLMIVETATNSGAGDPGADVGSAASFINGMRSYLKDVAGPKYGVIAVCWFDTDDTDHHDWRLDQTQASWQAWVSLARDPYFGGRPAS